LWGTNVPSRPADSSAARDSTEPQSACELKAWRHPGRCTLHARPIPSPPCTKRRVFNPAQTKNIRSVCIREKKNSNVISVGTCRHGRGQRRPIAEPGPLLFHGEWEGYTHRSISDARYASPGLMVSQTRANVNTGGGIRRDTSLLLAFPHASHVVSVPRSTPYVKTRDG